jgi:hypothetical protein
MMHMSRDLFASSSPSAARYTKALTIRRNHSLEEAIISIDNKRPHKLTRGVINSPAWFIALSSFIGAFING